MAILTHALPYPDLSILHHKQDSTMPDWLSPLDNVLFRYLPLADWQASKHCFAKQELEGPLDGPDQARWTTACQHDLCRSLPGLLGKIPNSYQPKQDVLGFIAGCETVLKARLGDTNGPDRQDPPAPLIESQAEAGRTLSRTLMPDNDYDTYFDSPAYHRTTLLSSSAVRLYLIGAVEAAGATLTASPRALADGLHFALGCVARGGDGDPATVLRRHLATMLKEHRVLTHAAARRADADADSRPAALM